MICFRSFVNIYTILVLIFVVALPGVYSSPVIRPDIKVQLCGMRLKEALLFSCRLSPQGSLSSNQFSTFENGRDLPLEVIGKCCSSVCSISDLRRFCPKAQYSTTSSPQSSESLETSYYYSDSQETPQQPFHSEESDASEESPESYRGNEQQHENSELTGQIQTNDLVFVPHHSATINNKLKNIIIGSHRNRFTYRMDKQD